MSDAEEGERKPPKLIVLCFHSRRDPPPEQPEYSYLNIGHGAVRAGYRTPRDGPLSGRKTRRMFSPKLAKGENRELSRELAQDLYIAPGTPREDVRAQLVPFLIQESLLKGQALSDAATGFQAYLKKSFRAAGLSEERKDVWQQAFQDLVKNWYWPEDWRAWRKYVARCIHEATKKTRGRHKHAEGAKDQEGAEELADVGIDEDEFRKKVRRSDAQVHTLPSRSPWWPQLSIDELAEDLGTDGSYLYRLIRQGKISVQLYKAQKGDYERRVVTRAEADRLQGQFQETRRKKGTG